MGDGLVPRETTAALRARSLQRLQEGFARYIQFVSKATSWDTRDEMINLTPFIDCAGRLGHDPFMALGPIAATGADWMHETFDSFVVRTDVDLAGFGWSIVETADGPTYRFEFPPD